jgi:hypothetical protein
MMIILTTLMLLFLPLISVDAASRCLPSCSTHGTCNEELGRCDCPKHMSGDDCSHVADEKDLAIRCKAALYPDVKECIHSSWTFACLNNCNKRGKCISGFCHCRDGHYGADCSLSIGDQGKPVLLAGSNYTTRSSGPKIYVYELPPHLTSWVNTRRLDRPTHHLFWQRLLSSGALTADGNEADWFFIPIRCRGHQDSALLPAAIDVIKRTWPWWNQTQGAKHFAIHTGDLGINDSPQSFSDLMFNSTWLTHWGLYEDRDDVGWRRAHRPERDVVIPVYISFGHFKKFGFDLSPIHQPGLDNPTPRTQTFFFAGRICHDHKPPDPFWPNCRHRSGDHYSANVRQRVAYHHSNRTGYHVSVFTKSYGKEMRTSKFCLAPLGGGHGQRNIQAAIMGCIPVTIGDKVLQPFEPQIDWNKFSVQVLEKDIPNLHEILSKVEAEDGEMEKMQRAIRCAAQHFVYSTITGGVLGDDGKYDAFESTLAVLRSISKNPGTLMDQLYSVDPEFRLFMNCGNEEMDDIKPPEPSQEALCSHSHIDTVKKLRESCYSCLVGSSNSHGLPGGAICCRAKGGLSKCPRSWQ